MSSRISFKHCLCTAWNLYPSTALVNNNTIPDTYGTEVEDGMGVPSKSSFIKTPVITGECNEAARSKDSCISSTQTLLSNDNNSDESDTKSSSPTNSGKK